MAGGVDGHRSGVEGGGDLRVFGRHPFTEQAYPRPGRRPDPAEPAGFAHRDLVDVGQQYARVAAPGFRRDTVRARVVHEPVGQLARGPRREGLDLPFRGEDRVRDREQLGVGHALQIASGTNPIFVATEPPADRRGDSSGDDRGAVLEGVGRGCHSEIFSRATDIAPDTASDKNAMVRASCG
ncbi:hypothetical protein D6T64_14475 [Cryobacterium melibiosiphilum]|uniref:Uncharacterized protein n=1 Tax=Cryobacterium melibiosiphilum TaxID=995039 RepID=A0A3A5MBL2_9MICO|nr:hypothetical protein [Cryobacterium melibiosiphilum]RJT87510.1 hypothetical protein D6T64_14475 [Cryobacterium melibiosiphilum]